ncbi:MAG: ADP-ribosylglycohydrolase family protein [Gammaproteobacteria bacterium]|nr:ADP-ribosylglycohydrolase family protein [Gammaproteobacteria bacterium]
MSEPAAWILCALLAAIFVGANIANLQLMFKKDAGGSPVMLVGGIAGALAIYVAPVAGVRGYWWVALLIDLGTVPFFLLGFVGIAVEALGSPAFLRRIPLVRLLVSKAEPAPRDPYPLERAIIGCLLGTATGDAMGLALEGLSRSRQARIVGEDMRYRLLFGKGLTSDDTEHTCMVAQALIETSGYDNDQVEGRFRRNLAWRLRGWLLLLPAGIGLATLRAILKLWIGFPPKWSGVHSAGNGPAMRVGIVGVACAQDMDKALLITQAATRITHTHPDAETGALAVMLAARLAALGGEDVRPGEFLAEFAQHTGHDAGMAEPVRLACESAERGEPAAVFADSIGCEKGVSGWIRHTVPVVIQVWLTHQNDFRGAVDSIVRLGGDSDTTAAIVGAIVGARVGREGIPGEWLEDLREWPRTVAWMERLGRQLARHRANGTVGKGVPLSLAALALRNLLFIPLVLAHGFRRLAPPY